MAILHKNITAAADIHNPKWFSGANNGDYAFKNEKGELESTDELLLPSALNFVDGSVAPPTTNSGDIYILSSGGSVNAGWGSVALQDWVRYDGSAWNSITPQKSSLCYDKTADSLMIYDGAAWAALGGGGGGVNVYDNDGTLAGDRIMTMANRTFSFSSTSGYPIIKNSVGASASGQKILEIKATHLGAVTGCGGYIDFSSANGNYNVGRIHNYQFGSGNAGFRIFSLATDGTANLGSSYLGQDGYAALIGENVVARVSTEKVSLQGFTVIKGEDTLSTSSALKVYDGDTTPNLLVDFKNSGNVDINANWRANEGTLKVNSNNQSFVGMGLTDTTNGYYGGFFWRPTTQYLTIGSNTSGFAIEPTANNQAYVFTNTSFTSSKELIVNNDFTLNGNQEVNANWVASKGIINLNTSNQSFNGIGLTDTTTGYMGMFGYRPTNDFFVIESTSAISGISFNTNGNNRRMTITDGGVNISNLPTSASGLSSGDLYNDGGTVKIV